MNAYLQAYRTIQESFPDAGERFENAVREVYTSILKLGDCCVDIGAHTGKHTFPMLECVGRSGHVLAFEPIPEKFAALKRKRDSAGYPEQTLELHNLCAGDADELIKFHYLPSDPGKSGIALRDRLVGKYADETEITCQMVRIDRMRPNIRPKFIKIDVEGAEMRVLNGMENIIEAARPVFHTELGIDTLIPNGASAHNFFQFAQKHRYRVIDVTGREIATADQFQDSISASGVYDYIWLPYEFPDIDGVRSAIANAWE